MIPRRVLMLHCLERYPLAPGSRARGRLRRLVGRLAADVRAQPLESDVP